MPTAAFVNLTNTYTEHAVEEIISRTGFDTLHVTLHGRADQLDSNFNNWNRGDAYAGYSTMVLENKQKRKRGPIGVIELFFIGFLESNGTFDGLVSVVDGISEQTVTLTTSAGQNVTFQYYGQVTSWRYIVRQIPQPKNPRYRATLSSGVNTLTMFNPFPPDFDGTVAGQSKKVGRLSTFDREMLSPGVWGVVETWTNRIEPKKDIA